MKKQDRINKLNKFLKEEFNKEEKKYVEKLDYSSFLSGVEVGQEMAINQSKGKGYDGDN